MEVSNYCWSFQVPVGPMRVNQCQIVVCEMLHSLRMAAFIICSIICCYQYTQGKLHNCTWNKFIICWLTCKNTVDHGTQKSSHLKYTHNIKSALLGNRLDIGDAVIHLFFSGIKAYTIMKPLPGEITHPYSNPNGFLTKQSWNLGLNDAGRYLLVSLTKSTSGLAWLQLVFRHCKGIARNVHLFIGHDT